MIAIIILLLLVPQTPRQNKLLTDFLESGLFSNYIEASTVLKLFTISSITLFFIMILL